MTTINLKTNVRNGNNGISVIDFDGEVNGLAENTLIRKIMDREKRLDLFVKRVISQIMLQIQRDQCRLPVIAMNDIRLEIQVFKRIQHSFSKKRVS